MAITISVCRTDWGWVGTAASVAGLVRILLPVGTRESAVMGLRPLFPDAETGVNPHLVALQPKLQCYFRGEDVSFQDQLLDMSQATEFLARVWDVVRAIPRGQVRSYSWVAEQVGSSRAARAVGRAMAINPFPIVVPCHRVVGQHGQLTGFGGGLEMKGRLLAMEGARLLTA